MLIYDMPSKEDMQVGLPLRSVLDIQYTEILEASGLPRDLIYLTPLVGCTPLVAVEETQSAKAMEVVRAPKPAEVEACQKRIHEIIYAVDPKLIFIAGVMAFKSLVPGQYRLSDTTLSKAAGKLFAATVPGRTRPISYPVMAIMGPIDIMKNPSAADHGPIGITSTAVKKALEYVRYVEDMK
jgi:uracil-DNA glycosylase family 4